MVIRSIESWKRFWLWFSIRSKRRGWTGYSSIFGESLWMRRSKERLLRLAIKLARLDGLDVRARDVSSNHDAF